MEKNYIMHKKLIMITKLLLSYMYNQELVIDHNQA